MAKIKFEPKNRGLIAEEKKDSKKESPSANNGKKGGRPIKSSSGQKATNRVGFYLTDNDFNNLKIKALEQGMLPGEFVKELITTHLVQD